MVRTRDVELFAAVLLVIEIPDPAAASSSSLPEIEACCWGVASVGRAPSKLRASAAEVIGAMTDQLNGGPGSKE